MYPEGKRATPTPKSDAAKDRTSQLAAERSLGLMAMTKTTKPFPIAVVMEKKQPRKLNHSSIVIVALKIALCLYGMRTFVT